MVALGRSPLHQESPPEYLQGTIKLNESRECKQNVVTDEGEVTKRRALRGDIVGTYAPCYGNKPGVAPLKPRYAGRNRNVTSGITIR